MVNKETLLADIYKYYPSGLNKGNNQNNKKEQLRQKKIKNKNKLLQQEIFKNILDIAKGYAVVDWTEEESCCYEFKVLLHKNQLILDDDIELIRSLNGVRNDLRIFISILEPYYYLFIEEMKYVEEKEAWLFNKIEARDEKVKIMLKEINEYFSKNGYIRLSYHDVKRSVPNIETELKEFNKVIVFDCLFTDLVTII